MIDPAWVSGCGRVTLYRGDALDVMRSLPDNSVDLVATDPPYFKVKTEEWDRAWADDAAFLSWLGTCADEWARVLRPNGSLYCFASPRMSARVEMEIGRRMAILNSIVWGKPTRGFSHTPGRAHKEGLRAFFPWTERIIFAEHYGSDNIAKGEAGYGAKCDELRGFVFEPLRAYLADERDRAGVSNGEINDAWCAWKGVACTSQTQKWFSSSCFNPPTREAYEWLRALFNSRGGDDYLRREYEDLRREYEDLRREYEDLRRPFSVSADVPYTDVWTFPTVQAYPGKHPCEKPLEMMEHIVSASSRPDAVVLDCFLGSGTTGVACVRLGRRFIGVERDAAHFEQARHRIASALEPATVEPVYEQTTIAEIAS